MNSSNSSSKDRLECKIHGKSHIPGRDFTVIEFTTELLSFFHLIRYLIDHAGKFASAEPMQIEGGQEMEIFSSRERIDALDYLRLLVVISDTSAGLYCELGPKIGNEYGRHGTICLRSIHSQTPRHAWVYSEFSPNAIEWHFYEIESWISKDTLLPHSEFREMIDRFERARDFASWLKTCDSMPVVSYETRDEVFGKDC